MTSRSSRLFRLSACLASLCVAAPLGSATAEVQVKVALLYNFAKYVRWGADTQAAQGAGFVIAVLGVDPFGAVIDEVLHAKRVGDSPVVVRRLGRTDALAGARILYVSESERGDLARILKRAEDAGVLTVGEMDRFAERGGGRPRSARGSR